MRCARAKAQDRESYWVNAERSVIFLLNYKKIGYVGIGYIEHRKDSTLKILYK